MRSCDRALRLAGRFSVQTRVPGCGVVEMTRSEG